MLSNFSHRPVRRAGAAAVCGLALASVLAGCGAQDVSAGGGGDSTLEYWTFINPTGTDPRALALAKNIEEFEAEHPGVSVEVTTLPWANIDAQLMQASNAGNGPDVVRLLDANLPMHVAAGNIVSLNDLVPAGADEDWLLGWDTLMFDGEKMAIPLEYRASSFFYRTDYLGADTPPKTWDEMTASVEALGDDRPGLVLTLNAGAGAMAMGEFFVPYLWAEGAEVFDEQGNAAFNSPEGIRAFERFGSLVEDSVAPAEVTSYPYEQVVQSVQAGAANYWFLGSHQYASTVATAGLAGKLKIAPLPAIEAGTPTPAFVNGWTLAVGKDSGSPDLAAEFIFSMTSAEAQLERAMNTGELPTRASVYEDEWFETPEAEAASMLFDWFSSEGRTLEYGEHYVELCQLWATALQQMVLEGADAQTVADEAAAEYDALVG